MSKKLDQTIYDVAVVGAGFGGALTALMAAQNGCKVLLLERGSHPRIVIGESTTPLTNLLLEEIATEFNLPFLLDFTQWGRWKTNHPDIRVGLKRGFGFYNHRNTSSDLSDHLWNQELMVAASPNNQVADTHWWREDWDAFLTDQAQLHGVTYLDQTQIDRFDETPDNIRLEINHEGKPASILARTFIDATGGASGIARWLGIPSLPLQYTPDSFSIYGHFEQVEPWTGLITTQVTNPPPYPPNQAAVHHLIDGGWAWCLAFDHGPVSAGAVLTKDRYATIQQNNPESIWQTVLDQNPQLKSHFKHAKPMYPMRKINQLGYRMDRMHGNRWIMLPSAAGFVDPLLSTGFPLTLQGIKRIGRMLNPEKLKKKGSIQSFEETAVITFRELSICDHLIGTLFTTMDKFRHFAATSMLYFAAVSYTETAWRLGKYHLAPGFLFSENPEQQNTFSNALNQIQKTQTGNKTDEEKWTTIQDIISTTIEPFNVIGLDPKAILPWFPADTTPLFQKAHKLESTPDEIKSMLIRCGLMFE